MRRLANAGLTLMLSGLVVGAIALAAFPAATGTTPVSIKTGSMQAELPAGSLAYIHAEPEYRIGDVVTFPVNGEFVTHELIGHPLSMSKFGERDPDRWTTQGSSNAVPDTWALPNDQIKGRVVYSIPYAGLALRVLSYPVVWAFLGLVCLAFLVMTRQPEPHHISPAGAGAR